MESWTSSAYSHSVYSRHSRTAPPIVLKTCCLHSRAHERISLLVYHTHNEHNAYEHAKTAISIMELYSSIQIKRCVTNPTQLNAATHVQRHTGRRGVVLSQAILFVLIYYASIRTRNQVGASSPSPAGNIVVSALSVLSLVVLVKTNPLNRAHGNCVITERKKWNMIFSFFLGGDRRER